MLKIMKKKLKYSWHSSIPVLQWIASKMHVRWNAHANVTQPAAWYSCSSSGSQVFPEKKKAFDWHKHLLVWQLFQPHDCRLCSHFTPVLLPVMRAPRFRHKQNPIPTNPHYITAAAASIKRHATALLMFHHQPHHSVLQQVPDCLQRHFSLYERVRKSWRLVLTFHILIINKAIFDIAVWKTQGNYSAKLVTVYAYATCRFRFVWNHD